jgi:hypothetical protein
MFLAATWSPAPPGRINALLLLLLLLLLQTAR